MAPQTELNKIQNWIEFRTSACFNYAFDIEHAKPAVRR